MKIIISTNSAWTLYEFRLSLILKLKEIGHEVIAVAPKDKYLKKFKNHGVRYRNVSIPITQNNVFSEFKAIFSYYLIYKEENPDLVHHFSIKPIIYGSIASRILKISSSINTITGLGIGFSKKKGLRSLIIKLLFKFSRSKKFQYIFQNMYDRDFFIENKFINKSQAHIVLGSGINMSKYSSKGKNIFAKGNKFIKFIMYSRMIWDKGVREYLEASKIFSNLYPNKATFTLLGGPDPKNINRVDAEWITNPNAIPLNWLKEKVHDYGVEWYPHDNNVLPYILRNDVIVLPTYYPEGLPRSILESMSCERIVIATDVPGCKDIVQDGITGYLVKPRSVSSLVQAFERIMNNTLEAAEISRQAKKSIEKKFCDVVVIEKVLKVYNLMK